MVTFNLNNATLESIDYFAITSNEDFYIIVDVIGDVEIYRNSNGLQYGDYLTLNEDEFELSITVYNSDEDIVEKSDYFTDQEIETLKEITISKLFELKYKEVTSEEY